MRWFKELPVRRKVLLFLSGGMVSLVADVFVSHFSWNNLTMRWTQTIPVVYGLIAFVVLGVAAVFRLSSVAENLVEKIIGGLGVAVGLTGEIFHGITFLDNVKGEPRTILAVGKAMSLSAPPFAPAAFAGVGLLLIALRSIAPRVEEALHHHPMVPQERPPG
jgi:uncharacterized membrane protein